MNNIRYASIRNLDISNGEGVGVALFVQGCPFHCHNCFNTETWDFNGGKEWTNKTKEKFLQLSSRKYITRISLLGGEPLAEENLDEVLELVKEIRYLFPKKTIWLYSGYTWNTIWDDTLKKMVNKGIGSLSLSEECENTLNIVEKRRKIISRCDVMVDGAYIDSQRDTTLKWRGSSNQRVIDVQNTLKKGKIVLWTE